MYRVVIIDDEPLVLADLKASIDWGTDFEFAGGFTRPIEAIEFIKEQKPDVVFTDIKMPKITGLRLIEILHEAGLTCLFVIVSGYDEFAYAQSAIRNGAVDYCLKPVSAEVIDPLMNRLRQILASKAASDQKQEWPQGAESVFEKVLRYIAEHLDRPITLDEVAGQFFINKSYLCSLFKKNKCTTFSLYVAEQKVDRSIELMRNTGFSLEDIALAVGYKDYYYFSRVFKRISAYSPREYQKRMKGQAP